MTRRPSLVALAQDYLSFRRGLGFAMRIEGAELMRFARYADAIGHRGPVTADLALAWARLPKDADRLYWARRLDIVRRFAKHRALFDPATEIPPDRVFGPSYRRRSPHIYSEREIASLLQAAGRLGPAGGLRPHTYVTLFGLLVSTGLRISEALRLTREEVDLEAGLLIVSETKFHKSRLIPLHPTTAAALRRYADRRDGYHPLVRLPAFFLTEWGTSLKYWRVLMTFSALRRDLGWDRLGGSPRRIHNIRHSFAVRRLLRWYEEGVDIDNKIAVLSTYLGHAKVTDTYWYLTAVPELLAVAAARYEAYAGRRLRGRP